MHHWLVVLALSARRPCLCQHRGSPCSGWHRRTFAVNLLEAMRADHEPSDLAIERLAMLAHLGFAAEIDPAWIEEMLGAQQPEGCFPADAAIRCHPHPTGLALWVLGHVLAPPR